MPERIPTLGGLDITQCQPIHRVIWLRFESGRHEIGFGRLIAAGCGFYVAHLGKSFLEGGQQVAVGAPLENFRDENAVGTEDIEGKISRDFTQHDGSQVIRGTVTSSRSRHITQDDIDRACQKRSDFVGGIRLRHIHCQVLRAFHRLDLKDVDRNHMILTYSFNRNLGPAAWRGAQIHDPTTGFQEAESVVNLG